MYSLYLYWWLVSSVKPVITIGQTSYETIVGSSVSLICTISPASQALSVSWRRTLNGATLIVDMGSDRYSGGTVLTPSLVIKNTTLSDTGEYICSATNDAGVSAGSTIVLTVQGSKFKSMWIFPLMHNWDLTPFPTLIWCSTWHWHQTLITATVLIVSVCCFTLLYFCSNKTKNDDHLI